MVRPSRFIKGADAGAVQHEMHHVSLHHADVGEANIGIGVEQYLKRPRCAVVLRRTVLGGAGDGAQLGGVDERCRVGGGAREVSPDVLQENLPDDDVNHRDSRNGRSPCDQTADDCR